MEKIKNMKDIFQGPVYEFLINESLNNRNGWGGNAGSIDGFSEYDLENSKKGNTFMREFLMEYKPYNILETGTNYGSFSYTCYETLNDFKLYTCDNHPDNNSMRCINFINEYYDDNKVRYFHKESKHFLTDLRNDETKFDLAWLDSTHTYEFLLEELNIVADMKVPFIMVDDFWTQKELQLAVFEFLRQNDEYRFHSYSNVRANVGAIILLQRLESVNTNLNIKE